jgi:hypothetical protein
MSIISEAKRAANRANAQKSAGPKSAGGKLASRFNALKHGLCAEQAVLPGEDAHDFVALSHEMLARFRPVGRAERALVDRAALQLWRLRRAGLAETACLAVQAGQVDVACEADGRPETVGEMAALGVAFAADFEGRRMVERLAGYEARIERSLEKALKLLALMRAERPAGTPAWRDPGAEPLGPPSPAELAAFEAEAERNLERSRREEREWAERERRRKAAPPQGGLSRILERAASWLEKTRIPAAFGFVPQNRWKPAAT